MDEIKTCNRWGKLLGVDPLRLRKRLDEAGEKPVSLPSLHAHRKPRSLYTKSQIEKALMAGAGEASSRGHFVAALLYIPNDGNPAQLCATLSDPGLVTELMRGVVELHAQGRSTVIPLGAQKVLADLEALRRERLPAEASEPSKPETPPPSQLAAAPKERE